jgi:hypothetical protein
MNEFKQLILGNVSVAYYLAAEFFALLALILSLYMSSKKRDSNSSSTPVEFSWLFLIWDNTKRIVVGQITLFLIFRFVTELLGRELNMWIAVGVGFFLSFGLDKAIQIIKERSSLFDMNREKMIEKISTTGDKSNSNQ